MTADQLYVQTLGGLWVRLNGQDVKFETRKVAALFVYLLGTGRPQPREVLATMFWEYHPQADALRNFRRMLSNLRSDLGDFIIAPHAGDTVSVDAEQQIDFDFAELEARLLEQMQVDLLTQDHVQTLHETLQSYRGDFLQGFYVDSTEFDRWASVERDRIRQRVMQAHRRLANHYQQYGNYLGALDHVQRLLVMDNLDEAAHQQLILLLALSGQRTLALKHFSICEDLLREELGIQPDKQMVELVERIRAGESLVDFEPDQDEISEILTRTATFKRIPHNLPQHATPFIGRDQERHDIGTIILTGTHRLITLAGPGGVGKTRLALKIAEECLQAFPDGAYWVGLAELEDPAQISSAVSAAIGLKFTPGQETSTQLLEHLQNKQMLLIFDNLEHLSEDSDLILDILQTTPEVVILTTSRERLNLRDEALFPLDGLAYTSVAQAEHIFDTDAGRLFLSSAHRVAPQFTPDMNDKIAIARICRLVNGLPLAIELAAGWVAMLTVPEILVELEHGLDLLATDARDVPVRHQSIRAVFDTSWAGLDVTEQAVLRRLAVFVGGFTRHAAQTVAGAGLHMLNMLMSKSLVYRPQDGRYALHDLLRQYVLQMPDPDTTKDFSVAQAHCRYFADLLAKEETRIRAGHQNEALADMDNLLTAWEYATRHEDLDAIRHLAEGLWAIFEMQGWYQAGSRTFGMTVDALGNRPNPVARVVYGRCLALFGWFVGRLGDVQHGYEHVKAGLDIIELAGDEEAYAITNILLSNLAQSPNELQDARVRLQKSLDLLGNSNLSRIGSALIQMSEIENILGNLDEARHYAEEAKQIEIQLGGSPRLLAGVDHALGAVHQELGEYEQARQKFLNSLETYRSLKYMHGMAWALLSLGKLELDAGQTDDAHYYFVQALKAVVKEDVSPAMLDAILGIARVYRQQKRIDDAVRLSAFVADHTHLHTELHEPAQQLLITLQDLINDRAFREARLDGNHLDVNAIVSIVDSES